MSTINIFLLFASSALAAQAFFGTVLQTPATTTKLPLMMPLLK
jgi:hypothetical protein